MMSLHNENAETPHAPLHQVFSDWWWKNIGNRDDATARARAARFRRADALTILADPTVHNLAQQLRLGPQQAASLLRSVQTLALVRTRGASLPKALGGKKPVLSNQRFERLIRSAPDDIGQTVRRALPMVGHACDPGRLAADLFHWNEPTRIRWTFDYFDVPSPDADGPDALAEKGTS